MMSRTLAGAAALAMMWAVGCDHATDPAPSNIVVFTATLTPGNQVPAPVGAASGAGTFTAVLDTVTHVMSYDVTFSGLTSLVTGGHLHGPAEPGSGAPPVLDFTTLPGGTLVTNVTAGVAHGTVLLTSATTFTATIGGDSLRTLLFAGKLYADILTTTNGAGEIRGQVVRR